MVSPLRRRLRTNSTDPDMPPLTSDESDEDPQDAKAAKYELQKHSLLCAFMNMGNTAKQQRLEDFTNNLYVPPSADQLPPDPLGPV